MFFWKTRVRVPPGANAVVKDRIESKRPLWVGRDVPVYFLSSDPFLTKFAAEAACRERIIHKVTVQVKLTVLENELAELIANAGDSFVPKIVTVSAENIAGRRKVAGSIAAAIAAYIQSQSFFALQKEDAVKQALQPLLEEQCKDARLAVTIEACSEISHRDPDDTLLAELAAQAGREEVGDGAEKQVTYKNTELGELVEYFDQARREKRNRELEVQIEIKRTEAENTACIKKLEAENEVEIERTKAEAGPLLEQLRQKTIVEKNNTTIREQQELYRVKAEEEKGKEQEAEWQKEAIERNSAIKEMNARYQAEYNERRLDEEMALNKRQQDDELALQKTRLEEEKNLAAARAEVTKAKKEEAEMLREKKRLDMELELEREKKLAELRADEMTKIAAQLGVVVERIKMPVPDYSNVHTLLLGSQDNKAGDMVATLLMDLLNRFADGVTSLRQTNGSQREDEVPARPAAEEGPSPKDNAE
ncbi:MAG: hypothetical protein HQ582_12040 [Planctomycetes bacterium]|nr:hypothetical protein [Planctomycetota bacterium]